MLWCPNCREPYRDEFTHCADCGRPLQEKAQGEDNLPQGELAFLPHTHFLTVTEAFEADRIKALLTSEGIRVVEKYRSGLPESSIGIRQYSQGIDLLVPEVELEHAKAMISDSGFGIGIDAGQEDCGEINNPMKKATRFGVRIYLVLFLLILLATAVGAAVDIMKSLFP